MSTNANLVAHPESLLVAHGRDARPGAPLNRPLVPASNFLFGADREYSRNEGTPSWEALEEIVGGLEDARAISFSSGMAGVAAVFDQLAVGAQVVIPSDCYQGVAQLAEVGRQKGIWSLRRIAVEDTAAWQHAAADADLIWLESPSNPLLTVGDLRAICAAQRKAGALVAVDNTFATALNQRPLDLGADIAFQSATKFIGGHSDLLSGVLTVRHEDLYARLRRSRSLAGATPGALESFLAVRGARTMAVRLERAQQNAGVLAERLLGHARVTTVRYPGLPSHPTHAVARAQLKGFGSMLSFDVRGSAEDAEAVCTRLRLIHHTTSLGAVESMIERRARNVGQEHLPPTLLRLSVGIEHVDDLWADLRAALEA
ncbi:MAG: PLP-dependent transferase [Polyangiales bacterium]